MYNKVGVLSTPVTEGQKIKNVIEDEVSKETELL